MFGWRKSGLFSSRSCLLVVARAENELDVVAVSRHVFEQAVFVVQQPPAASHDQHGRHRVRLNCLRISSLSQDVQKSGCTGMPVTSMRAIGNAVLHQLALHDRRRDEVFVHLGACPRAVRVVIRYEREQRDVQPQPLQARDDRVRDRMRAHDGVRLELGDDLGRLGIEQPMQGELRETVERALVVGTVQVPDQFRLLRHRFAVCRDNQRPEHRIEKFAQFEHFRLDIGIEMPDADGQRIGGLGVSGTEPFREQKHSFLALVHRLTHFSYISYYESVRGLTRDERSPEQTDVQPLMKAVLSVFR